MKTNLKKITVIIIVALLFAMSGCELFTRPVPNIINITYSPDEDHTVILTEKVIDSCVEVIASNGSGSSASGSGVIIAATNGETFIITNSHVVTSSPTLDTAYSTIKVIFFGETNGVTASVVAGARSSSKDKTTDLALLKVNNSLFGKDRAAVAADGGSLRYGQRILAIGNGQNLGTSVCDGLIANPVVQFKNSDTLTCPLIQISAPVNPGNSGGALFDMKGSLIGINTLKLVAETARPSTGSGSVNIYADNISFALPISNVVKFLSDCGKSDLLTISNG